LQARQDDKPKHVAKHATLVVARQSPKPSRAQCESGTKVAVTLAVKKPAKKAKSKPHER